MAIEKRWVGACAVLAVAVLAPVTAEAKCMRISGTGTAITNALAGENAKMAVSEAIAARGAKARGRMSVSCKYDLVVSTCKASQRACK